ncbi:hypothetical protein O1W68_03655 [Rhodococcus sp. H36-A4]|uniref:hypothetical protein n=1 Tax=Rhodococcus sp. H36-A4 TaxID=3004353 RepID=UPI0022AEA533|nr:hypothetical protein [Rhodococcus sp. H36-A4]MCZ4077029.1 hypothetical protein [Rhodococcus sp. H36-A4]
MRRSAVWLPLAVVVCSSCSFGLQMVGIDTVSFRPPTASVVESADCLSRDIYTALTGVGPWDPAIASTAPEVGYPPAGFEPVAVVRCERGVGSSGEMSVDSVRLQGDVSAVADAFSARSSRYADNISASCALAVDVPAGLWLVDDAGQAFRPAWPSAPCGFQDDPLEPLRMLDEVSRSVHPTGVAVDALGCGGASGSEFENTTTEDVDAAVEREREGGRIRPPALAMPTSDVGGLQVCRYPVEPAGLDGSYVVPGSTLALNRSDSAALAIPLADAPVAQPCSLDATQMASTVLLRPDGSGGTRVSFELDGCRRAVGFDGFRELSDAALAVLSRP